MIVVKSDSPEEDDGSSVEFVCDKAHSDSSVESALPVRLGRLELLSDPLCPGDVVEYVNPIFVYCDKHVSTSVVKYVKPTPVPSLDNDDRAEASSLVLMDGTNLPNCSRVRRIGIASVPLEANGTIEYKWNPDACFRTIHRFILEEGSLTNAQCVKLSTLTLTGRYQEGLKKAREVLKEAGVPVDMMADLSARR